MGITGIGKSVSNLGYFHLILRRNSCNRMFNLARRYCLPWYNLVFSDNIRTESEIISGDKLIGNCIGVKSYAKSVFLTGGIRGVKST